MRKQGFTLVELITVVVILGILAVYVAPRIFTSQGDEVMAAETSLVSLLRLQQQRAMQDTEKALAYGLDLQQTGDQIELIPIGPGASSSQTVSFSGIELVPIVHQLRFNASGCINTCGEQDLTITLVGQTTRSVCVNRQGFITHGPCQTS